MTTQLRWRKPRILADYHKLEKYNGETDGYEVIAVVWNDSLEAVTTFPWTPWKARVITATK